MARNGIEKHGAARPIGGAVVRGEGGAQERADAEHSVLRPGLLDDLPETYSTPELRVDCPDDVKFDVVARISGHFSKTNKVITIDGARILFDHGWGLVRASNTQAILVLRFEADSEEHLATIRETVESKVDEFITAASN